MKLVLCSADINEAITSKICEFANKPASEIAVAIINEASAVEDGDKRWLINGMNSIQKTFGGSVDIVNLLSLTLNDSLQRLYKADVVWCFGGSTDYLKLIFEKTGFASVLPKLLENKVWVGSSAGSCILGKRGSYKAEVALYKDDLRYDINDYLAICNFCIFPHMHSPDSFNVCIEESKRQPYPIFALSDSSAVAVDGEKIYLVGKNCQKLENGKITEEQ